MLKFLKKTALWILAVPVLFLFLGNVSNQAVLVANHDKFPVMWNDYKVAQYAFQIEEVADNPENPESAQAQFDMVALKEEGFLDDTHCVMTSKTRLNFLADWIDFGDATYSPGDFLLMLGEEGMKYFPILWAAVVISRLNKKEE